MSKGINKLAVGDTFDGFLLIKDAAKSVASNNKPFLTLILRDRSGEIEAKLWDITPEDEATFVNEVIVQVSGTINQFRGKNQLRINTIRPSSVADGMKVSDFIEKAPIELEEVMEKLTEAIFEMKNPTIQRIVRAFIKKYQEELLTYPAATKNHHEYASGLAHHIMGMLALGKEICRLYPQLNQDLLLAGIILHDLGKIHELSGVASTTYTLEGKLLGHITIMVEEIGEIAAELKINDEEEVLLLKHLVLSHHSKGEWGSPKPPLIQEAEVLHYIDQLDAKLNMMSRALVKVNKGEFTERIFPMENRSLYKPLID